MGLQHVGYIQLPSHAKPGGFDHATVHGRLGRVYVAHTANGVVDVIDCSTHRAVAKVPVSVRPNGLAYDPGRRRLLAVNVGDPSGPDSFTVSIVDVETKTRIADVRVAGRKRWSVFDPEADVFHVNIVDPPQIVDVRCCPADFSDGHVETALGVLSGAEDRAAQGDVSVVIRPEDVWVDDDGPFSRRVECVTCLGGRSRRRSAGPVGDCGH